MRESLIARQPHDHFSFFHFVSRPIILTMKYGIGSDRSEMEEARREEKQKNLPSFVANSLTRGMYTTPGLCGWVFTQCRAHERCWFLSKASLSMPTVIHNEFFGWWKKKQSHKISLKEKRLSNNAGKSVLLGSDETGNLFKCPACLLINYRVFLYFLQYVYVI